MTYADVALADRPPANSDGARPGAAFLETARLRSLVSPVGVGEFVARYWEQQPLVINRKSPDYYGDLFTLADFDNAAARISGYVKVADATQKKQSRHHGAGAQSKDRILTDMRDGSTLILDGVQQYDLKLGRLCNRMAQEMNFLFQTNLYLTPPNGKGFLPHWDNHDVFILQVLGSKHWKIEKQRRLIPEKDANTPDEDREFRGELTSFTLEQGDMVYIPRGLIHAAECGSDISLHITLGVHPYTWDDLLITAVRTAALRDEGLRLTMPPGHMKMPHGELVEPLVKALRGMMDRDFLAQVVDQYRNEIVKKFPLDISGQVSAHFQPLPVTPGDRFSPREGVVCTLNPGTESISVYVGTRVVTFPDFFSDALKFALETPVYAVGDLPGDLETEERAAFIERLMQEGLVVRK